MAYTNIDDPSAYFQTKIWTGSGQTNRTITNDGNSDLQPDMLWAKSRSSVTQHVIYDSTRGAGKQILPNVTNAEGTAATGYNLTGFATDGFITGANQFNLISGGNDYVAWQWKANGGTTVSNTDGNTTTTVQANQDAGFSIVTYTGTGSSSQTMGHGLGVTPNIVLTKARSGTSNWSFNGNFGGMTYGTNKLLLNSTGALASDTNEVKAASSTTFTGGGSGAVNGNGSTYVAYCFAEKQGYSKFGSYIGNGNNNGPFIYTGFKPAFIMTKKSSAAGGGWFIQDIKRGIKNNDTNTPVLQANGNFSEAQVGFTDYEIDFLSNGFKLRDNNTYVNLSGTTYIYMAFAENPFTTSTGIPTTAR